MSLLTVAQNIVRGIGLPVPTSIHGNTNQDAVRLLQAINDAGRFLAQKSWTILQKEALLTVTTLSVTTSTSTHVSAYNDSYALASDFKALIPSTSWNRTSRRMVGGPIRAQKWQNLKSGFTHVGIFDEFRIKVSAASKQLFISPIPTSPDIFVYEYRSTDWVQTSAGTSTETTWTSAGGDGSTTLIEEYLVELEAKWRFYKAIGQSYGTEKQEARDAINTAFADDGGMQVIIAGHNSGEFDHFPAVTPETSVGL